MSSENQPAEMMFAEAMEIADPAARRTYLSRTCAGNPALLEEVESLLAAHEQASKFMTPEAIHGSLPHPAGKSGDRIGRYRLLEQIGEGGFGVVWMAEQEEPVQRRVALKIIKLGMDTREVVARFEAERQALAMMDHPNIARVFDGGATETGRPYFVMELVKGVPITEYCDTAKLPTRERLDLFMRVCQAVQHAHQKGVIHRDLKPSNILVTETDGRPVPKVIDFGVAKATQARLTDKTLFTRFQQWIGTPAYMSPEQAGLGSLDVDTRSDVYSLGVLLYELLTGRTPFDTHQSLEVGYEAVMRTIREEEPPKPSTRLSTLADAELETVAAQRGAESAKLGRLVRGDLDWIVMKALEKDRRRRYETPDAFAADVERHLNNEPVAAGPPSALYRFRKLIRRRRYGLATAAVILLLLVAGVVVSTRQAVRAREAELLAKQHLAESEAVSQFLIRVFQSPDPARSGRSITVAEMLDRAVKKLDRDLASLPACRASLQATLGDTYLALGLARESIPLLEKARDYQLAAFGPHHPQTLGAIHNLATSYFDAGRWDEALKLRVEVLTLSRKVNGPEHPDTLDAINNVTCSYLHAGRRDEALNLREEVLLLRRKVNGPEDPKTLVAMNNLAISYFEAARWQQALELREKALALSRKVNGPEHPDTLRAMHDLAISCSCTGRRDEALKLREEVLSLRRKLNGPEHPSTLGAMHNLANSCFDAGRRDAAFKLREEVLALSRKVNGPEHPSTVMAMNSLAISCFGTGRWDEALKLREEVLALRCKQNGPEHPDTLSAMHNLAISYFQAGRWEEAARLREEVLTLRRKVNGPAHPDTLKAMRNLAMSYSCAAANRRDEALKLCEEALALSRTALGHDHSDTLMSMQDLASSLADAGRSGEALKLREEVLARCRGINGPEHPVTVRAMRHLGDSYAAASLPDEALKLRLEALPLSRVVFGADHPDTIAAMQNLASSLADAGRTAEALKLREEVLALERKVPYKNGATIKLPAESNRPRDDREIRP